MISVSHSYLIHGLNFLCIGYSIKPEKQTQNIMQLRLQSRSKSFSGSHLVLSRVFSLNPLCPFINFPSSWSNMQNSVSVKDEQSSFVSLAAVSE